MLVLLACLLLVGVTSLLLGAGDVGPLAAWSVLIGSGSDEARFVVESLRLPRTLIGVAVGMALGVAGSLIQAVARNPLAEPGLLGVSAGSALAVAIALVLGASAATL
ncbi:MAG: iron chelate uptake ABC transporter family permease subunit, partial [Pseudomonadota bacterium]|nr:iron chelate uptake ABC transporter family permease subunit [Pseudomonadota bacterium]